MEVSDGTSNVLSTTEETVDDPDIVEINPSSGSHASGEGAAAAVASTSGVSVPALVPVAPPSGSGIVPRVHNVVASVDLKCKLDLMRIALRVKNAEYNPRRFNAVVMRIREPRTAALVFRNGKIVVTGAADESASHLACRKYARILQKLGHPIRGFDYKISSILATFDARFPVQLDRMYSSHVQFASYEPELFPGLIYRMVKPKIVLLVFVTGKVVIMGGRSRSELSEAFENLYPVLRTFRKQ